MGTPRLDQQMRWRSVELDPNDPLDVENEQWVRIGRSVGELRALGSIGDLDGAEEDLMKAVRITEELGDRQLGGWLWRSLAKVSDRRGNEHEAEERRRRSREAQTFLERSLERVATSQT